MNNQGSVAKNWSLSQESIIVASTAIKQMLVMITTNHHLKSCTSDNDDGFYSWLVVELCAEQGALLLLAKQ
jgi:hypothetical protein